ncbi:hypothetical protein PFICI_01698 [Pestalotiopsis fici W106-1]|uniref:DUF6546 domain-containing protein n=1 Tax=Pestalotiopsis fici (strain W106-1 / CGMCC3.15140) TaxID=1229662 RepID=W3XPI3_PESFW|nr:uncharacterized protein PFICI_01698 [Pestalotiopsis fici W106-1]ETS87870.1 hypothetical protein PFICI_01698 [Pestalotiopsis fici W106-1]
MEKVGPDPHGLPLLTRPRDLPTTQTRVPQSDTVAWDSLPHELKYKIWELLLSPKHMATPSRQGGAPSNHLQTNYATVAREWQAFFEKYNFSSLVLHQYDLPDFRSILNRDRTDRRLSLRRLWLHVELSSHPGQRYEGYSLPEPAQTNSSIYTFALWDLFTTFKQWENDIKGSGKELTLALVLSVYSLEYCFRRPPFRRVRMCKDLLMHDQMEPFPFSFNVQGQLVSDCGIDWRHIETPLDSNLVNNLYQHYLCGVGNASEWSLDTDYFSIPGEISRRRQTAMPLSPSTWIPETTSPCPGGGISSRQTGDETMRDLHPSIGDGLLHFPSLEPNSSTQSIYFGPSRIHAEPLPLKFDLAHVGADSLPSLDFVHSLWTPRQFGKTIPKLSYVFNALPMLKTIQFESWHLGRVGGLSQILTQLPPHVEKVVMYEDFDCLESNRKDLDIYPRLGENLRIASLNLVELEASFIVDAFWFFQPFTTEIDRLKPASEWKRLETLTLTSIKLTRAPETLTPTSIRLTRAPETTQLQFSSKPRVETNSTLLVAAAYAALHMPKLRIMQLWSDGTGHVGIDEYEHKPCIFRYTANCHRHAPLIEWVDNEKPATELPWIVAKSWQMVADKYRHGEIRTLSSTMAPYNHPTRPSVRKHLITSQDLKDSQSCVLCNNCGRLVG